MFYVTCPTCQERIEIPASAYGPDRDDLFNTVCCDDCGISFDYDDEEVIDDEQPTN